jgi:opacity protein-like surface antigen
VGLVHEDTIHIVLRRSDMRVTILAVAALFASGMTPAFADNDRGFYAGAGVGLFNIEVDDVDTIDELDQAFDSDDTVFKVFAGYRFNPFIGVEVDYIDLGGPEDTVENVKVKAEINGVAPYLIGTLPLGPIEAFARVGYYFYDVEISGQDLGSVDDSGEDLVYGVGIGLTLFEHLHARLEYEIIDVSEVDDANAIWLSGAWRF